MVGTRDKQPPVVSALGCGDVVVDPLNTNGGVGDAVTILCRSLCPLPLCVDLCGQTRAHIYEQMSLCHCVMNSSYKESSDTRLHANEYTVFNKIRK